MVLVRQDAGNPGHIVIVNKCHEMLSAVDAPLFRSELTVQGMGDLEKIHAVETGINPLIALIVCTAVEHLIVYDQL